MKHSLTRSIVISTCTTLAIGISSESPIGYIAETLIARRLEFHLRAQVHKEPILDPRIKILAYDSSALNLIKQEDIQLDQWGQVFSAIADQKPKAILIDKGFAIPRGFEQLEAFKKRMSAISVPIIIGSYVQPRNDLKDNILNPHREDFSLQKLLKGNDPSDLDRLEWLPQNSGYIIGPESHLQDSFTKIGHFTVEKYGLVKPFMRVEREWAVPHWSLVLADSIQITRSQLFANQAEIPLDRHDMIVPNLITSEILAKRTFSLRSFFYRTFKNMPLEGIDPGDVVIILPGMYPGNGDWVDTPLERLQGGYLMVAMANSVLTGKWLTPLGYRVPIFFLLCMIGMYAATHFRSYAFNFSMIGTSTCLVVVSFFVFCNFGVIVPWFFPLVGLFTTGGFVYADRARANELRMHNLKTALRGHISSERIAQVLKDPSSLQKKPQGKIVSIMFIDIVGFSQMSEQQTPEEAFHALRDLFAILRSIVLEAGGVVDKTLGDGMLCYFGCGPDGQDTIKDHPDVALRCGIKIQEATLEKNLAASAMGQQIFPLRIGINSSSVFVGNIGDADNYDFTVIGHGVNIAKRLESACAHYCINIGSSTYDTLTNRDAFEKQLIKRLIPIKHSDAPIESYECNPFPDRGGEVNKIGSAYRRALGIDRKEERWPVPREINIYLHSAYGQTRLVDFSRTGFCVAMDHYIGTGILIDFHITLTSEQIDATTMSEKIIEQKFILVGEVRWGRPIENGFLHGILIKNLSADQRIELVDSIRKMIRRETDHLAA